LHLLHQALLAPVDVTVHKRTFIEPWLSRTVKGEAMIHPMSGGPHPDPLITVIHLDDPGFVYVSPERNHQILSLQLILITLALFIHYPKNDCTLPSLISIRILNSFILLKAVGALPIMIIKNSSFELVRMEFAWIDEGDLLLAEGTLK
jgi:hypothetical protein